MQYTITGEIAQSVRLDFDAGETAWASNGSLMGYSPGLQWKLRMPGGVGGAVRRSLSGEGLSLTHLFEDYGKDRAEAIDRHLPAYIATRALKL